MTRDNAGSTEREPRYPQVIPDRWMGEIMLSFMAAFVGLGAYALMEGTPTAMEAMFVYSACVTGVLAITVLENAVKGVWTRV